MALVIGEKIVPIIKNHLTIQKPVLIVRKLVILLTNVRSQ